jgi:uncharacterized protein
MSNSPKGVFPAAMYDPYADDMTQPFWTSALKDQLSCARCTNCGIFRMPPSAYCFNCQHQEVEWVDLPGTATIYTFTVVRHPLRPDLKEAVPYVTAVVELDGTQGAGARMMANVINCDVDKVRIGDKIKVTFEKVSDIMAIPRFEPV